MTRDETKMLLAVIASCYPNYHPTDLKTTLDVWTTLLQEYDFDELKVALQSYVITDTSGFAPSIGQLISKYVQLTTPVVMNSMEAWALVDKALRSGNSQGEYDNLPPLVQKAVGSPNNLHNWGMSDEKTVETVICSNFKKAYESVVEQNRQYQSLPSNIQSLLNQTSQSLLGVSG